MEELKHYKDELFRYQELQKNLGKLKYSMYALTFCVIYILILWTLSEFENDNIGLLLGVGLIFIVIGWVFLFNSGNTLKKNKQLINKKIRDINEQINLDKLNNEERSAKERILREQERIKILLENQKLVLKELDKDGNGEVDDIEGEDDFGKLLRKHQDKIIEIDRKYIQEFVKVSNYIKTKKNNIQSIFNSLEKTNYDNELDSMFKLLKNQVHTYQLVLLNSFNMITSLVNDDMITFYEIHNSFDKLNMFNSNWENEVSNKLTDIGKGIRELIYSINQMEMNIVSELSNLSYVTEGLKESVSQELNEVQSSINTNNLLTAVQTYQMYKVNVNTKGLNR